MSSIRILFVEDSLDDLTLVNRVLKKAGFDYTYEYADTVPKLSEALKQPWDIIVSDYHLPGFTALDVLKIVRGTNSTIPIIVMSGALGEEAAVEVMRAGATDYILKQNHERLPFVITREFNEAEERRKRKSAELALQESESRFIQLANTIPQLAWMARPDGHIHWYNERWYEYTGTTLQEMEGWGWEKVHRPDGLPKMLPAWKKALATGQPWEDIFELRSKSGQFRWFLSRAYPVRNSGGEIVHWFGTNTDIHDVREAQHEMVKAKEEAERANQLKSAFLANMSHEIRTPLGAMLGFADLMRDTTISEAQRQNFIEILTRNGEQLSIIIDDILDLSKVEAGHLVLEFKDANAETLAGEVLSLMKVKAKEKDLALELELQLSAPRSIVTDPTRLRQILLNLIGNAIKFTQVGLVRIKVFGEKDRSGRVGLAFEVTDTGIGIAEDKLDRVFEVFVQADGSMTRKFGGTGLGLSLSRKLARELGGDITIVTSAEGKGSTFKLWLPDLPERRTEAHPSLAVTLATEELAPNVLDGVKVLVIDDAPDNRQLIWRILSKRGALIDSAENGLLGYQKAMDGNYDVLIMDIQMPVMDGYTATNKLRQDGYRKPIIALTAHAMTEVRQKCLSVGCTDHLAKPINPKDLIQAVARHAK